MGAKGREGQEALTTGLGGPLGAQTPTCTVAWSVRVGRHRWDTAGGGGLGFSGVPGTLTSIQLQPPEDCPGPGHEPPGNKQGQQPADWYVFPASTM